MLISLILSKTNYFFHCKYPQLTVGRICLHHSMTAFRLLLSAKAVCLLFVTKQHSGTISPFSIIMQNVFRTRNAHRENYSSGEIFWHTKKIFPRQRWKAPCHSLLITASFLSMHREANSLGDVTEAFTNMQSGIWPVSSLHRARPHLSPCTLIGMFFNYNY